jgi:hypothetical protein
MQNAVEQHFFISGNFNTVAGPRNLNRRAPTDF